MPEKSFPSKKKEHPGYQKNALILCILILLIAVGCFMGIIAKTSGTYSSSSLYADIYQNGQLKQTIALATVTEPYTLTVYGENGCTNTIEVRPGSIGILSADCPDKLCVNQGFISNSQLPITCLPNRLVIQIRQDTSNRIAIEDTNTDSITPDIVTY